VSIRRKPMANEVNPEIMEAKAREREQEPRDIAHIPATPAARCSLEPRNSFLEIIGAGCALQ
jgi:hypothetical protein